MTVACLIIVWGQHNLTLVRPSQLFPGGREDQRDRVNRRKGDGDNEHWARFRFRRPDGDVDPYGGDAPDDIFPGYDHDEADEVHEEEYAESGPLVVCVLIGFAWFPSVPEFNARGFVSGSS